MGFTVYYRSTEPVDAPKRAALNAAADRLCSGRSWLSCEPVFFFSADDDGHLMGGSKPNFHPHPDDVAAAKSEGLPDGTTADALDVLSQLSRDHDVDWEISHDYSEGPIGFIRSGQADAEVLGQIEEIGGVADMLGGPGSDDPFGEPPDDDHGGLRIFRPDDA